MPSRRHPSSSAPLPSSAPDTFFSTRHSTVKSHSPNQIISQMTENPTDSLEESIFSDLENITRAWGSTKKEYYQQGR